MLFLPDEHVLHYFKRARCARELWRLVLAQYLVQRGKQAANLSPRTIAV